VPEVFMPARQGIIGVLLRLSLQGSLPLSIMLLALLAGAMALQLTPREEEPQIVVPMVDVLVTVPGASAQQVERQVTTPLEKLLAQIPGVEHIYSTSSTGQTVVTIRFYVGEDREEALLNTYNKLHANADKVPPIVSQWQVSPVEVDDVPIILFGLWSSDPARYSDYELRRLADEVAVHLQALDDTSQVLVSGGRTRAVQLLLDAESLAARKTTMSDIVQALAISNTRASLGHWRSGNESLWLESGDVLHSASQLGESVINVVDGVPVYLQEVAQVVDGPDEPRGYQWLNLPQSTQQYPLVTLSIAKQQGSNAVSVASAAHAKIAELKRTLLPPGVEVEVLRDYGATADAKVNELTSSLVFAVLTVVVFIAIFLGPRPALVVGLAIPICYGITLALDLALGYSINRVTLFALILALGLLVDDPITGVDNIERHMASGTGNLNARIAAAMFEIRTPLLMSTLTIVLAFIPLAFITGMMGPYMAPMAFNVPVSVMVSTLVAFLVTPWLSSKLLQRGQLQDQDALPDTAFNRFYRRLLTPLLTNRRRARGLLWLILGLFILAAILPLLRLVPLKLLPLDNKSELQIVLDMPEHATLETTAAMATRIASEVRRLPEVNAIAAYVGEPSPMDFNGMVRHYYQRQAPYLADLRITLIDKADREQQSHAIVLRLRQLLAPLARDGIVLRVVETPPGPPVLSTLVAEIYADSRLPYSAQQDAARLVAARLQREPLVTEVDTSIGGEQTRLLFVTDKVKAALSGVSTADINQTLATATQGQIAGYLQQPHETAPLPIILRLPLAERSGIADLARLPLKGRAGIVQQSGANGLEPAPQPLVALGELGQFIRLPADQPILHKDLRPLVMVMAEISGRTPAEVIADVNADLGAAPGAPSDWRYRTHILPGGGDGWQLPQGIDVVWSGEGEWLITVEVFRDMGLAFAFALAAIFVVLRIQTRSTALALIIMSAIPLTVIGIMPGFWLLNVATAGVIAGAPDPSLFTATAMIGMIALAGIVVRNSLILIDFIEQARSAGLPQQEALLRAGMVRTRPVLLTAGTTLLGNLVITLDPVFSGLALAIMFGIIASTLFTLVVVPVVYQLVFSDSPGAVEEGSS
jgi:multidrug efflux pump subunit AcrB